MAGENHNGNCYLKRAVILIALLVISGVQVAACPKDKPFKRLSRPEKVWSVLHPFKAHNVLLCAREAQFITDSLETAGVLTDKNGGQLDAFRHSYWTALMICIGMKENVVRKIGERHEKGNYIDFKQGKREDGARSDSLMCVMDLRNNESGIAIGKKWRAGDRKISLIETLINEITNGNLSIMSKNAYGAYLDSKGEVIDLGSYKGKWYIPKVIVSSNMIVVPH